MRAQPRLLKYQHLRIFRAPSPGHFDSWETLQIWEHFRNYIASLSFAELHTASRNPMHLRLCPARPAAARHFKKILPLETKRHPTLNAPNAHRARVQPSANQGYFASERFVTQSPEDSGIQLVSHSDPQNMIHLMELWGHLEKWTRRILTSEPTREGVEPVQRCLSARFQSSSVGFRQPPVPMFDNATNLQETTKAKANKRIYVI